MSRWLIFPAWFLAIAATAAFWWWQGRPIAVPDAPSKIIPCVSFAPHRGSQSAMDPELIIPAAQIEEDLKLLSHHTRCVRTYGVGQGLDRVPEIAERFGIKVMLGAWLSPNDADNARQMEVALDLANRFPETVTALIVGNEVLLRGDLPEHKLVEHLRKARESVLMPVTYADVTDFWFRHRSLADDVDFVTIHILPYWDDDPVGVDETMARARTLWKEAREVFPNTPLFVGEAGWPSAGRMRGEALPSRVNQAQFVRELLELAKSENMDLNLIEAFDQPWKRVNEGTVGGYWGLFSESREEKWPLTGPVSNDPSWHVHLAWSVAIAAIPMALVLAFRRRISSTGWLFLCLTSHAAACALVLAMLNVSQTSIDTADWVVGLARWSLAVVAFALTVTASVVSRASSPNTLTMMPALNLLEALKSGKFASLRGLAPALGLVWILTLFGAAVATLGLVFDARYRDFPVLVYLVPTIAFAVLVLCRRQNREADLREESLLAWILAAGGIAIVLLEGFVNHQAMAWAAVNFVLAGTVAYQKHSCRRARPL